MNIEDKVQEIHDRVRRMETLLFKLAEQSGVTRTTVEPVVEILDSGDIRVIGYDVTLARIKRELKTTGKFKVDMTVGIWVGDDYIGEVVFCES